MLGKSEEHAGINTEVGLKDETEVEISGDKIRTMRTEDGTYRVKEVVNMMSEVLFIHEKDVSVEIEEVKEEEEEKEEKEKEKEGQKEIDLSKEKKPSESEKENDRNEDIGEEFLVEGRENSENEDFVMKVDEVLDFETEVIVKKASGDQSLIQL